MLTAYFMAAVRGPMGDEAPTDTVLANVVRAVAVAERIQSWFPRSLRIRVPHMDLLPDNLGPAEILREEGLISHDDIIRADCIIATRQDFGISLNPQSPGMRLEAMAILAAGKSVFPIDTTDEATREQLTLFIMGLEEAKDEACSDSQV